MYTDAALLKRESIKLEPVVRFVLLQLYESVDEDSSGHLDKEEYTKLVGRLYSCLRLFWDEELPVLSPSEMKQTAEDDWETDRDGHSYIDFGRFMTAMFSLCDVWTDAVDGDTYLAFLCRLQSRLTTSDFETRGNPKRLVGGNAVRVALRPESEMVALKAAERKGIIIARTPKERCIAVLEMYDLRSNCWHISEDLASLLTKGLNSESMQKQDRWATSTQVVLLL